jgi:ketosteroid isomerase-like protein
MPGSQRREGGHTMQRSAEVREAFTRLLEHMSSGAEAWIDRAADTGDAAVLIGSAPAEWWAGPATREAWTAIARAFGRTGLRVLPGQPDGFAEGTIGWAVDRPTFRSRSGAETRTRMTAVFRREDGLWKVVHVHNSIGVPDEAVEAFRKLAVSPPAP